MYNIVELFSGIGSQAKALCNLNEKINTLGTCEWDYHAFIAYDAIHNSPYISDIYSELSREDILNELSGLSLSGDGKTPLLNTTLAKLTDDALRRIKAAIDRTNNFVDICKLNGDLMPENIDILTYSFPCQDLSNVGAFHGYNKGIDKDSGSRSSLLWQVGRILSEMKASSKTMPRYLLMENVPTLLAERHIGNFKQWINDLAELGYYSFYYELNSFWFGLPQNRPRLLMISVYCGEDKEKLKAVKDYFRLKPSSEDVVRDYVASDFYQKRTIGELLRNNYDDPILFAEAVECTPNNTVSRQVIWDENPQLVLEGNRLNEAHEYVRTITTKQDRNPNSGNLWINTGIDGRASFRYLTPRECFLFMGFTDADFEKLICNNTIAFGNHPIFPRDRIIRMAGNSIPVKLLEGIFYQIINIDLMLGEYKNN